LKLAIFQGDRPTELGDLAQKKRNISSRTRSPIANVQAN